MDCPVPSVGPADSGAVRAVDPPTDNGDLPHMAAAVGLLGASPPAGPAEPFEQLIQMQKLAALGTMAAMLAHEFNNLLTKALAYAEQAERYPDDRELTRTALEKIREHCTRAADISQSIFDFSGRAEDRHRPVNVLRIVQEAVACLGRDPAKDNIAIRCRVAGDLTVVGNGTLLQQVLYNLLLNGRQAILAMGRRGGRITVSADRTAGGQVAVRVSDSGCGIQPADLPKIFDPFFSTKTHADHADRKGIGLGLAICRQIIAEHAGTIEVASAPGEGATFTVILPGN